MDIKAVSVVIMAVGLIAVNREHRAQADQLHTLTQNIGKGDIIRAIIIRIEGQNASGQRIHHILAGGFHNDIPHKTGGKTSVIDE